jgi:hypothetical protein
MSPRERAFIDEIALALSGGVSTVLSYGPQDFRPQKECSRVIILDLIDSRY